MVDVEVELGSGVGDGSGVGTFLCTPQAAESMMTTAECKSNFFLSLLCREPANGLRYLRVGGRGQNFESRILFGRR
jgi:hypothetical protein